MSGGDYYKILGIDRYASPGDIKKAYRLLGLCFSIVIRCILSDTLACTPVLQRKSTIRTWLSRMRYGPFNASSH